jgi:hypothetical protein
MANVDAPFGFRAVRMQGSGPSTNGQTQYLIANGYGTAIFQGDPVEMVAGGTLEVANGVADVVVGVFNGVNYVDVNTRKPIWSNYHAASTSSYDGIIKAFVQDDPDQLFEVQVSGAFANANIGETANLVYTAGSTHSGTSKAEVNSSTYSTGANTAVKIVGLSGDPENNDTSSDNCNIIVKFNKHLYSANTAGI